ncbi:MAG: alpha/beta fold hydrolase [Faecalibacterium sp.]
MLWNAKNGFLTLDEATVDYVCFGTGAQALLLIPGLGDGMTTVKGMALPLAWSYRAFAKQYRVYLFSRREPLPQGFTTRQMAADLAQAMEMLRIRQADVVGISQGGMIAQYLAIDFPQKVRRLVLAVTLARPNAMVRQVVGGWIELARKGDYRALMIDTAEKSYSEKRLKTYRLLYPVLGCFGKPKNKERFLTQASSCITHDAFAELGRIACPTLVLGGEQDRIVGPQGSRELSEKISDSTLYLYPELGHAAYEEAKDFNTRIQAFLGGRTGTV